MIWWSLSAHLQTWSENLLLIPVSIGWEVAVYPLAGWVSAIWKKIAKAVADVLISGLRDPMSTMY